MSELTNYGGDITPSGKGFILLPYGGAWLPTTTPGGAIVTANVVLSMPVYIDQFIVATTLWYNLPQGSASTFHVGFGLYTPNGDSLLMSAIDTPAINTTGNKSLALSPAWVIPPGMYTYAFVCDSANPQLNTFGGRTAAITTQGNSLATPNKFLGSQAGGSAGSGVLPASLGTRASSTTELPAVILVS